MPTGGRRGGRWEGTAGLGAADGMAPQGQVGRRRTCLGKGFVQVDGSQPFWTSTSPLLTKGLDGPPPPALGRIVPSPHSCPSGPCVTAWKQALHVR